MGPHLFPSGERTTNVNSSIYESTLNESVLIHNQSKKSGMLYTAINKVLKKQGRRCYFCSYKNNTTLPFTE